MKIKLNTEPNFILYKNFRYTHKKTLLGPGGRTIFKCDIAFFSSER
jgi:hypothetical protein